MSQKQGLNYINQLYSQQYHFRIAIATAYMHAPCFLTFCSSDHPYFFLNSKFCFKYQFVHFLYTPCISMAIQQYPCMAAVEGQIYYPRHTSIIYGRTQLALQALIIDRTNIHHCARSLQLVRPVINNNPEHYIIKCVHGRLIRIALLIWRYNSCCVLFLVYQTYKSF